MNRRMLPPDSVAESGSVIELWAAGNVPAARSAVCGVAGTVLWCASRGHNDGLHPAWRQESAHTVAAAKAIWLASRSGAELLRLHVVDENTDRELLAQLAGAAGLGLDIDVVTESPASEWCRERYSKVGKSASRCAAAALRPAEPPHWSASGMAVA
jgi:hypothetical protein